MLRAANELLIDVGLHAMTVGTIAERADVAKRTIYRWWPSQVLEQYATHGGTAFTESATGRVLFMLIGHALHDTATTGPGSRGLAATTAVQPRPHPGGHDALSPPRTPVTRHDADQFLGLLAGPAFHRAAMTGRPLDARFIRQLSRCVGPPGQRPAPGVPSPDPSA